MQRVRLEKEDARAEAVAEQRDAHATPGAGATAWHRGQLLQKLFYSCVPPPPPGLRPEPHADQLDTGIFSKACRLAQAGSSRYQGAWPAGGAPSSSSGTREGTRPPSAQLLQPERAKTSWTSCWGRPHSGQPLPEVQSGLLRTHCRALCQHMGLSHSEGCCRPYPCTCTKLDVHVTLQLGCRRLHTRERGQRQERRDGPVLQHGQGAAAGASHAARALQRSHAGGVPAHPDAPAGSSHVCPACAAFSHARRAGALARQLTAGPLLLKPSAAWLHCLLQASAAPVTSSQGPLWAQDIAWLHKPEQGTHCAGQAQRLRRAHRHLFVCR